MAQDVKTTVIQYYLSMFNRAPDGEGLAYWINALNSGASTTDVIRGMLTSQAAAPYYPSFFTPAETITSFYQNVLGRAPDAQGLSFWTNYNSTTASGDVAKTLEAIISTVVTFPTAKPAGMSQTDFEAGTLSAKLFAAKSAAAVTFVADPANYFPSKVSANGSTVFDNSFKLLADVTSQIKATSATSSSGLGQENVSANSPLDFDKSAANTMSTSDPTNFKANGSAGNDIFVVTASEANQMSVNGSTGKNLLQINVSDTDFNTIDAAKGYKDVALSSNNNQIVEVTTGGAQLGAENTEPASVNNTNLLDVVLTATAWKGYEAVGVNEVESDTGSVTINDLQAVVSTTGKGLYTYVQDTPSDVNFMFDKQTDQTQPIELELREVRGATINYGTTPASGSKVPADLPRTDAADVTTSPGTILGIVNQGYGTANTPNSDVYGLGTNTSNLTAVNIHSNVRPYSDKGQLEYKNTVQDLNIGPKIQKLTIDGDAQLKVGLDYSPEYQASNERFESNVKTAGAPNQSVSQGISVAINTALPTAFVSDIAFATRAYSLESSIRSIDASAHFAKVVDSAGNQTMRTDGINGADLTLDLSAATANETGTFTYLGSHGEDSINFGTRALNVNANLGDGNDTIISGVGQANIIGARGDDVIKHGNVSNETGVGGFAVAGLATVYGGSGNDAVMLGSEARPIIDPDHNLVDLGVGADTLDVHGPADNFVSGGLGVDRILLRGDGNNVIYADVAASGSLSGDGVTSVDADYVVPGARSYAIDANSDREQTIGARSMPRTVDPITGQFIADSYFATANSGSATDSDTVRLQGNGNNYVNLGNGDNNLAVASVTDGILNGNNIAESGGGLDTVIIKADGTKQVNTRQGNDLIATEGVGNVTILSGAEYADTVADNDTVKTFGDGDRKIASGSGNDSISTTGLGNVTVLSGTGNDTVLVAGDSTENSGQWLSAGAHHPINYIDLGAGNDSLTIQNAGARNGVTEIWGRQGSDAVAILNADLTVNTDHTLYVDLGSESDSIELRARDVKNDDTVSGGVQWNNTGNIDKIIFNNSGDTDANGRVLASETQNVNHFEMIGLKGDGVYVELTNNLIQTMDQNVSVGALTKAVYSQGVGNNLPSDGAPLDGSNMGATANDDGLFAAGVRGANGLVANTNMNGVLGTTGIYDVKGVLTVEALDGSAVDANAVNDVLADNATWQDAGFRSLDITKITPLMEPNAFVNFLGGQFADQVVVNEDTMNSASNLRFDWYSYDVLNARYVRDDDNSLSDMLTVKDSGGADISFGDYRNVDGLDAMKFTSGGSGANFSLEVSKYLVMQSTPNADGTYDVQVLKATGADTLRFYAEGGQELTGAGTLAADGGTVSIVDAGDHWNLTFQG